jgi:hypothetical protein
MSVTHNHTSAADNSPAAVNGLGEGPPACQRLPVIGGIMTDRIHNRKLAAAQTSSFSYGMPTAEVRVNAFTGHPTLLQ